MKVAILGCGPAGLFAAHAVGSLGHDIRILSNKRKSEMFGAQYLHRPIPDFSNRAPDFNILYVLNGTDLGYAEKVYGDVPPDFVSPARLEGEHAGWDIRTAYDRAWETLESAIIDTGKMTSRFLGTQVTRGGLLYGADAVINTIPLNTICYGFHDFTARSVWAIGDAPERGIECPVKVLPDTVVCDGTSDVGWYRASNIHGFKTAEWPEETKPPISDVALVTKVVRTNCNCWPSFVRTGRYGAWDKRLLTHHAFYGILETFQADGRR